MSNTIQVLGAHGAKSKEGGSTSFSLNEKHAIDAGNILLPLEEKSAQIEVIWVTHSHLDHIADIAYILDNYYEERTETLKIYALEKTISTLKKHFFNDEIWPDFSKIALKNSEKMSLSFHRLDVGKIYEIGEGKTVQAFLGDHSVPSVGYLIQQRKSSVLVSTDTYSLTHIVQMVESDSSITSLILECSFPVRMSKLAETSKHLTAQHLFEGIRPLKDRNIKLYINHIKPVYNDEIQCEIKLYKETWDVSILEDGDIIPF